MVKFNPYILIIAALVIVIILMQKCEKESNFTEIDIPAKEGKFEPEKPQQNKIEKETVIKWRDSIIKIQNPVNKELLKNYQDVSDSLSKREAEIQRLNLYIQAIEINQYKQTFEDSLVKIDISGKVQGEIQEMKADYTIKQSTFKTKKKNFSVGPYFGYDAIHNKPSFGISINYGLIRF